MSGKAKTGRANVVQRMLAVVLAVLVGASGLLITETDVARADEPTALGTWGIRASYRSYINGPIAHGTTVADEGAVWLDGAGNGKGPFTWPVASATFDPATEVGEVAFAGRVYTAGHDYGSGYILELELSDLRLAIAGHVGTLYADLEYRPFVGASPSTPPPAVQYADDAAFATVDLAGVTWPTEAGGDLAITNAPATGVAATMALIGWDQFYSGEMPDIALEPLSVSASTTAPEPEPEPGAVTGAQLRWGFSRYAQYGVFGAWSQVATGPNVSVTQAEGQSISGNPEDAGLPFELGVFDGGTGTIDPVTGAGTITWDTGDWVLNAYNGQFGAPDETFRDPILTVEPDGSGTLSFELFIPDAVDMAGNPVPGAGPARKVVATFSSLAELTATSLDVTPDFAGRPYHWPPGSGVQYNEDCDGAGGSWPTEYIDFVPSSIQLHYYTSSCSGLNTKKPPLPFAVDWAPAPIAIAAQPSAPATVDAGTPLPLTVVATGNPAPLYQWQRSTDGSTWADLDGLTGSTATITPLAADDGASYRVVLTGEGGPLASDPVTLDVVTQPAAITSHPASQTVGEGTLTTFNVGASGKPAPAIQWQRSDDDGATWVDLPAPANPNYYQLTPTAGADDGAQFRAVATNPEATVTSNVATLSVTTAPPAFTNPNLPADRTTGEGGLGYFQLAISGSPPPAIQWQRSDDDGATWADIDGATGIEHRIEQSASTDDGARFRAVITNPYGGPLTSREATLTVTFAPPTFSLHPTDRVVGRGEAATFTSWTAGSPTPTVQWQRSDDDGATWADIEGATGSTYTTAATTDEDDGARFRVVATNPHGVVPSDPATLDVRFEAPALAQQPADVTSFAGHQALFNAVVEAYPAATHQWQSSTDDGATWADVDGATSATLTLGDLTTAMTGHQHRVVATNGAGSATSDAATLTVVEPTGGRQVVATPSELDADGPTSLEVVGAGFTPPDDVTGNVRLALVDAAVWQPGQAGSTSGVVAFVTLTRASLVSSGGWFQRTLTVPAGSLDPAEHYGLATFSQTAGQRYWDSWTPVLVEGQEPAPDEAPAITGQPAGRSAFEGSPVTFTVAASGWPSPTFQWELSTDGGATWGDVASGGTTATLTVAGVTAAQDGHLYRATATNAAGSATSAPAELSVVATTGDPQLLLDPAWVADPAGSTTVSISGAGFDAPAGIWVVLVPTANWDAQDVDSYEAGAMVWTSVSGSALSGGGGRFTTSLDLSGLDPEQSYHVITYSQTFSDRSWDAGVHVPFTEPGPSPELTPITGATFEWAINSGHQTAAPNGVCNHLIAGKDDGYRSEAGGVSIIRRLPDGTAIKVVESNRCDMTDGLIRQSGLFTGGTGARNPVTGEATVQWSGAVRIDAYGGLVPWYIEDPELVVGADGKGRVTARVGGFGGSMENPGVLVPLTPVEDVVVADLTGVEVGSATGFTLVPDYAGIDYFPLLPEGGRSTTSAISDDAKARFPGTWGSWPQSFVDFQYTTGLSSYWHTSDAAGTNEGKPPLPITVAYDAGMPARLPAWLTHPATQTVTHETDATFIASAESAPADGEVSYAWQSQAPASSEWVTVEGATSSTLVLPSVTVSAWNGAKVRAIATNATGSLPGNPATLTVKELAAPVITQQPTDLTGIVGHTITPSFQVRATGYPDVAFQWQRSTDGGATWEDWEGKTAQSLGIGAVDGSEHLLKVRAVVSNGVGDPVVSDVGTLYVITPDGSKQAVVVPRPIDPTVANTLRVAGAGFLPLEGETASLRIAIVESGTWAPGQEPPTTWVQTTTQTATTRRNANGRIQFTWPLAAGKLDASKSYDVAFFSNDAANRAHDLVVPLELVGQDPEPIVVTGAQLEWGYSQYAQYGVFGAWRMWSDGPGVSITQRDGQAVSGDPVDAGRPFNVGVFDGGTGTIDPVTGAGTISWDTGDWVINAYPANLGAPDETYSDPVLTIGADGSGTLSMNVYLPSHADFLGGGGMVPAVGPERIVVATFDSVDDLGAAGFSVDPDFEGRTYTTPEGLASLDCEGAGGSWPAELIDFLPGSVRPHYFTTSCSGLNLKKPPLPFDVSLAPVAPSIVSQPTNPPATVPAGSELGIELVVAGNPTPAVQWQRSLDGGTTWVDVAGATSAAYPFTAAVDDDGARFRALVGTGGGQITSDPTTEVAVTTEAAAITFHPQDLTVGRGELATFGIGTTGAPPPSIQWQRSDDDGATWADIDGATAASYRLESAADADSGARLRAVVTNGYGDPVVLTSDAATLTVLFEAPQITTQPTDRTTFAGLSVTFDAAYSAVPAATRQWQVSSDDGATWIDIEGATAGTHSLPSPTPADDGNLYRMVVTNAAGATTSDAAELTVLATTGERRVVVLPEGPIDPAEPTTIQVLGEGYLPPAEVTGSIRVAVTDTSVWQPGQTGVTSGHVVMGLLGRPALVTSGGLFSLALTVPAGALDPAKDYGVAMFSSSTGQRYWDTWQPLELLVPEPEPGAVEGIVTAPGSGEPLEGVCAYLYAGFDSGYTGQAYCTGADGRYAFLGVDPGERYVAVYDPQARFFTAWEPVVIPDGATATEDIQLEAGASIAGRITDTASGEGIEACVYLYGADGDPAGHATCSRPDGYYALPGVPDGSYKVGIGDPSGWRTSFWSGGGTDVASATTVAISATSVAIVDGTLAQLARIELTPVDGSAAPVAGTCLYLYDDDVVDLASAYALHGGCVGAGETELALLVPAGTYKVVVFDPGAVHQTTWVGGTTVSEADPVPLVPGLNDLGTLTLAPVG